jgi:hypothetical protein
LEWLLLLEAFALRAKPVDLRVHPRQQEFSRCRGYPGSLKLEDFLALAGYLNPPAFDCGPDVI